jgi:cytochrome oxidase assembly protein ShyY1
MQQPLNPPQRPRRLRFWLLTLAALAMFAVTVSLGRWQLSRAAEKEALQAAIDAQKDYPPLDMTGFLAIEDMASEMHRRVRLRGLWLADQTVWLDNRQMHGGTPGFYVLTPLALEGSDRTLMVQRGWVQRNFVDRAQLPAIATPAGIVEVSGQIAPPPGRLLELGKAPTGNGPDAAPRSSPIRQNLDLEAFRAETGLPLRTDMTLLQTGPASEGLQRDWPAPALGIERHYGYAFQWFGLALLVAILYVWFQIIAPRRRA